jgi:hypothetical protein
LAEDNQTLERKVQLLFEQGNLFDAGNEYEEAIARWEKALRSVIAIVVQG